MYDELDYLTYQLLNEIENKIESAYNKYGTIISEHYVKKEWVKNEFVYVDDIKNIEEAIDRIGKYFGYPNDWVLKKEWDLNGVNSISYVDINRWTHNLDIIINSSYNPLLPKNDLYPSENLKPTNMKGDL